MPANVDFIVPGGALGGPLFARLLVDAEPARVLEPGTRIGPFRIVDLIGRGGAGLVYRALRDDDTYEHEVAIKIVRPDPRLVEPMRRERNLLGQLQHPGIARIFDGGDTDDEGLWYAMEFVRGQPLDEWCRVHAASWRRRVQLLIEVCDAVAYAHARFVVHRDLKPSNILVDESGLPRLLDFGIARDVSQPTPLDEAVAFTPGFASPEQVRGAPAATSSDIFQLGQLLAILLVDCDEPGRLVRRQLAAVVAKARAAEPSARYASVTGLCVDLQRVLAGKSAEAAKATVTTRVALLLSRHRTLSAVVFAAACILVAGTVYHTMRLARARDAAEEHARHASIASEVLADLFRTGDGDSGLERGVQATLQRFEPDSEAGAVATETIANVYLDLGMAEAAEALLANELQRYRPAIGADPVERVHLLLLQARAALQQGGRGSEAAKTLDEAAQIMTTRDQASERQMLESLRILEIEQAGDVAGARARRSALIEALSDRRADDIALLVQLLRDRARERTVVNDYAGAKLDAARAIELARRRFGALSPQSLAASRSMSWILVATGDLDAAAAGLDEQRDIAARTFGVESAEYADVLRAEGIVLSERADYRAAEAKFAEAYAVLRRRYGNDAAALAPAAHNVADMKLRLGDAAGALSLYEDALRIRRMTLADTDQTVVVNRLQIARANCELGKHAEANAGFANARQQLAALHPIGHPYVTTAAAMNVECLLRQRRIQEARAMADSENLASAANEHTSAAPRVRQALAALAAAEQSESGRH